MQMVKNTLPEGLCSGIVCLAGIQRQNRIARCMLSPVRQQHIKSRKNRATKSGQ